MAHLCSFLIASLVSAGCLGLGISARAQVSLPADEIRIWNEKDERAGKDDRISLSIRKIRPGVFRLDACFEGPQGTCRAPVFSSEDHTVSVKELTEAENYFRVAREAHEAKGLKPTPLYAEGEKAIGEAMDLLLNFREIKASAPPEGMATSRDVTLEITGPMNLAYTAYRMLKAKYGDLEHLRNLDPINAGAFPGLEAVPKTEPEVKENLPSSLH